MFDRLDAIVERYHKINSLLADPKITSDIKKLRDLSKELSGLEKTVTKYEEYKQVTNQIHDLKEMLDDMHKRKIDMANEIFVINKNGYIGNSTRSEIEYAKATGKNVLYLENNWI